MKYQSNFKNDFQIKFHYQTSFTRFQVINHYINIIWMPDLFVLFHVNTLQLTQPNKISSNQDPEFSPLLLSLIAISSVTLMLHSDPEFVHLGEVQQDKVNGIHYCSILIVVSTIQQYIFSFTPLYF